MESSPVPAPVPTVNPTVAQPMQGLGGQAPSTSSGNNMNGPAEKPSSVFEARKLELQHSKNVWRNWFLFNIIFLFLVAVLAFAGLMFNASLTAILLLELAVTLPLAYSAIFFHAQHNRDREYLEEYSFKSVVARSLEAYRLLLKEDVNPERAEEKKKLLDFIIDTAKNLHTSPRAMISKNPVRDEEDVKVGVVEKLADVFKKFIP